MDWKEIVKAYFHFTAKDRIALLVISLVLGFVILFPRFASRFKTDTVIPLTDTAWLSALKKIEQPVSANSPADTNNHSGPHFVGNDAPALFAFDPNTISREEWLKLGIRDRTVQTILNYLGKGGQFRRPEDLKKIYSLPPGEYQRLEPYIRIKRQAKESERETIYKQAFPRSNSTRAEDARKIDINLADSTSFLHLPGIGPVLASRIIRFREKLGGFYSIDQIAETFGLPDSVFKLIRPGLELKNMRLQTININTASLDELKQHPYIRFKIGSLIVNYRKQHGDFQNLEDLMKIALIKEDLFQKIKHYLTI